MPKFEDIDLMRYVDGEVTEAERAGISAQLVADSDARLKVEALGQVSDSVRGYLELSADQAEPLFDGLWSQIERRIEANGFHEAQAYEAAPPRRPTVDPDDGFLVAIGRWFGGSRGQFFAGALVAGAIAAFIVMLKAPNEHVVIKAADFQAVAPVAITVVSAPSPASVEELDVVNGAGHILTIPGEDGEVATTVLWLDLDQETLEDPI